jgi:hypothetical protein
MHSLSIVVNICSAIGLSANHLTSHFLSYPIAIKIRNDIPPEMLACLRWCRIIHSACPVVVCVISSGSTEELAAGFQLYIIAFCGLQSDHPHVFATGIGKFKSSTVTEKFEQAKYSRMSISGRKNDTCNAPACRLIPLIVADPAYKSSQNAQETSR